MTNPVIDQYGCYYWCNSDNKFHREDGPAIIGPKSHQEWYVNGFRHRSDGPAIIWADGTQSWWANGKHVWSNKEFQEAANITDEEMTLIVLKYGGVE